MINFHTWAVNQTCSNTEPTIKTFIKSSIYSGQPPSSTHAGLHCIIDNVADILNQLVKFHIIGADPEILVCNSLDEVFKVSVKHMLLTKIFYNYQAMAFITDKPEDNFHNAVLHRPDPPAHSLAGVATIRDHIYLVDPLHGHLEVHHDEVHNLASQPVYWDLVQTKTQLT